MTKQYFYYKKYKELLGRKLVDFGKFEPLKNPTAYVSSDAVIYRHDESGKLEVLTGVRQIDPWKNHTTVAFGGYVDPEDANPLCTATREALEETGLKIKIKELIGIYGPERWHHEFTCTPLLQKMFFFHKRLNVPAHIRPTVAFVFAAQVVGGMLHDTEEQRGLRWQKPNELNDKNFAFDHACVLYDFLCQQEDLRLRDTARNCLHSIY